MTPEISNMLSKCLDMSYSQYDRQMWTMVILITAVS